MTTFEILALVLLAGILVSHFVFHVSFASLKGFFHGKSTVAAPAPAPAPPVVVVHAPAPPAPAPIPPSFIPQPPVAAPSPAPAPALPPGTTYIPGITDGGSNASPAPAPAPLPSGAIPPSFIPGPGGQ